MEYDIMVMKLQQYTIADIFDKNLLLLLPFYIFSHERHFEEYERNETELGILKGEYEQIKDRLEALLNQGSISEYMRCTIIDMSNKVLEHIAKKYDAVRKGVKSVMGGKVLEYEAKTIRNEGLKEGIRGTVSILKKMNIPPQAIQAQIQEQYDLSPEESKKYL